MNRYRIFALAIAACAPFASFASAASAAPNGIHVRYADLDLSSKAGLSELDARIDHAIHRVCGEPMRSLQAQHDFTACVKATRADVQAVRAGALASANARRAQLALNAK